MGQSSAIITPLCMGLCPHQQFPQTLRSMKTHSPCALFWKPFWAKELSTLSFSSWVPPSTVCESSCPSLNGFEKSFSILFRKVQCFCVAGLSHPMTRAGARFSFLVVPAAGRSHRGPEHHWTGGHVRATCCEASRPLGASGSPAEAWGVGWRGGTFCLLRAAPPPRHGASKFPCCACPRLCLPHPLASCWGFLVPSSHSARFPPPQRDLNRLCAGGCRHGAPAAAAPPAAAAAPAVGG